VNLLQQRVHKQEARDGEKAIHLHSHTSCTDEEDRSLRLVQLIRLLDEDAVLEQHDHMARYHPGRQHHTKTLDLMEHGGEKGEPMATSYGWVGMCVYVTW
jgi:hypothetical protein